eukprot:14360363-Alexandrium_andersonii.AAC.1
MACKAKLRRSRIALLAPCACLCFCFGFLASAYAPRGVLSSALFGPVSMAWAAFACAWSGGCLPACFAAALPSAWVDLGGLPPRVGGSG